jgi:hypothetical protein
LVASFTVLSWGNTSSVVTELTETGLLVGTPQVGVLNLGDVSGEDANFSWLS